MNDIYAVIVEDQVDSAELVARILRFHGRVFRLAMSAEAAIALLEENRPQIILIDLALPTMDGWELLGVVRNTPFLSHIPVIAMTAFHSSRVAHDAVAAGFNAYFSKPLDATSFVRELDRIIESVSPVSVQTG